MQRNDLFLKQLARPSSLLTTEKSEVRRLKKGGTSAETHQHKRKEITERNAFGRKTTKPILRHDARVMITAVVTRLTSTTLTMSIKNIPRIPIVAQEIEAWVDAKFESAPIPHPIRDISLWHLLTVGEDWVRMHFNGMVEKSDNAIDQFIDQLKYSMKHCIQRILSEAELCESLPFPKKTSPKSYGASHQLLQAGLWHASMVRIFSSLYAGQSTIELNSQGEHCLAYSPNYDIRYSALEMLNHGEEVGVDITTLVFGLLRGTDARPELDAFFEPSTRVRNGRVIYKYEIGGLHLLSMIVPQRPIVIPDNFRFAWGNGVDTQALINSLLIRCAYHTLCIDFASKKFRLPGGFDSSLVLTISREDLIRDLAYLADFGAARISQFIDFLTLGRESDSPDVALQPLVKAANGQYMIASLFIISNDLQRNILSLMARTQKTDFDEQSKLFEQGMITDIVAACGQWPETKVNKTFRAAGHSEEIDLLLIDQQSRLLLALECAWMLQPGDPREVFNRLNTCIKKVDQIERKRDFLRKNLREILHSLSLDPTEVDQWNVDALVVIEGFGGQRSSVDDLPIVSMNALNLALAECTTLPALYRWAKSLEWLPESGRHFMPSDEKIETQPVEIHRVGFYLIGDKTRYVDHIRETAKHALRGA